MSLLNESIAETNDKLRSSESSPPEMIHAAATAALLFIELFQ